MLIARAVTYTYPGSDRGLMPPGVSMEASAGRLTAVVGESGSGKSTLLACLAGLLRPASGEIALDRRIVTEGGPDPSLPHRMLVLQNAALFEALPIWENVAIAWGLPRAKLRQRAVDHLEMLGLGELADKLPAALSLGQRQRAAIASAVASRPRLLLTDEPTGSLDAANAAKVGELLRQIAAQDRIVVMASHDPQLVELADDVVKLNAG